MRLDLVINGQVCEDQKVVITLCMQKKRDKTTSLGVKKRGEAFFIWFHAINIKKISYVAKKPHQNRHECKKNLRYLAPGAVLVWQEGIQADKQHEMFGNHVSAVVVIRSDIHSGYLLIPQAAHRITIAFIVGSAGDTPMIKIDAATPGLIGVFLCAGPEIAVVAH